jgi:hypothetical protein
VPSLRSTPLLLVLCLVNRGGGEGEALGTVFLALQCAVHLAATDVVAHEKPFRSAAHPLALRHDVGAVGRGKEEWAADRGIGSVRTGNGVGAGRRRTSDTGLRWRSVTARGSSSHCRRPCAQWPEKGGGGQRADEDPFDDHITIPAVYYLQKLLDGAGPLDGEKRRRRTSGIWQLAETH